MNTYVIHTRFEDADEVPLVPVYTVFYRWGFADALEHALKNIRYWYTRRQPQVGDLFIVKLDKSEAYKVFQLQSLNPIRFSRP